MKVLFSLCLVVLIVTPLLPLASAHGVRTGIPPRFGRLDDVHFSSQSVQTGDTIIITGNITTMVQQELQGYLSIHSSPSPHARWIVVSTEPSEKMINVTQFSRIPFSITIKALQSGTYKLSPVLYLPEIGPAFGMLNGCNTEPVVTVTGESMCNTGFVSVLKAEDGSSFCVKPDTAQKLIERGWGTLLGMQTSFPSGNIENNATQPLIPPSQLPHLPLGNLPANNTALEFSKIPNWNTKFVCEKYPGYAIEMTAKISNAMKFSGTITDPNGIIRHVASIALNNTQTQIRFSASTSDPDGVYVIAFNVVNNTNTSNVNFNCIGTEMVEPMLHPALHAPLP